MISWWQHLSWSHATLVVLLIVWALMLAWIVGRSLGSENRPIPPRKERRRHRRHWYPRRWPIEQHRSYFSDCRRVPEDQQ